MSYNHYANYQHPANGGYGQYAQDQQNQQPDIPQSLPFPDPANRPASNGYHGGPSYNQMPAYGQYGQPNGSYMPQQQFHQQQPQQYGQQSQYGRSPQPHALPSPQQASMNNTLPQLQQMRYPQYQSPVNQYMSAPPQQAWPQQQQNHAHQMQPGRVAPSPTVPSFTNAAATTHQEVPSVYASPNMNPSNANTSYYRHQTYSPHPPPASSPQIPVRPTPSPSLSSQPQMQIPQSPQSTMPRRESVAQFPPTQPPQQLQRPPSQNSHHGIPQQTVPSPAVPKPASIPASKPSPRPAPLPAPQPAMSKSTAPKSAAPKPAVLNLEAPQRASPNLTPPVSTPANLPLTIDPSQLMMSRVEIKAPTPSHTKPLEPVLSAEEQQIKDRLDKLPFDLVLLALSDEYIGAAHKLGPRVATLENDEDIKEYHNMISAGLGCLEACIKLQFHHQPRFEAALTLRYASLMYEETENLEHIEDILSKGMSFCDRNHFSDFKYALRHLLIRTMFKRNPKVAFKSLDTAVQEVEQYRHVHWIYVFRFLRVSLSLELGDHRELTVALQHLEKLVAKSEQQGDDVVTITASTLEAYLHLQTESSDNVLNAVRSVAKARSFQLNGQVRDSVPEVWALLAAVDLATTLLQYKTDQIKDKSEQMQKFYEDLLIDQKCWSSDGTISVFLNKRTSAQVKDFTCQTFSKNDNGQIYFELSWLHKEEAYVLAYLLSGIGQVLKNAAEPRADTYFAEAKRVIQDLFKEKSLSDQDVIPDSASRFAMSRRLDWAHSVEWYVDLYSVFLSCMRTNWAEARQLLNSLDTKIEDLDQTRAEQLSRWTTYVHGIIEQGSGNLDQAVAIFSSPLLLNSVKLTSPAKRAAPNTAMDDISVLSRLNLLMILRSATDPPSHEAEQLLQDLKVMLPKSHPNTALHAGQALVDTLIYPHTTISHKKASLQSALAASRTAGNAQLLARIMIAMVGMFFTDIIGKQAHRGRTTALELARRAHDPLWVAVAGGIRLRGFVESGDDAEAMDRGEEEKRLIVKEVEAAMKSIPAALRDGQ